MSNWNLMRVMLLKEIRMTFRERAQFMRIGLSLVVLLLVLGNTAFQFSRPSHHRAESRDETVLAQNPAMEEMVVHWVAIIGAAMGGFLFSSGYLVSAILACFVGEKENRTLEVLLASPLTDLKLFLMKSASVLVPSAVLGGAFAIVGIVAASSFMSQFHPVISEVLIYGLVFGWPALVLLQTCVVGLGAAISVKAETMKGAGQTLGAVLMLLIFGVGYGVPLLLGLSPTLQQMAAEWLKSWAKWGFALQYGMVLLGLVIVASLFVGVGRVLFRRDRMLT
jgi:ABC-2 type transporter